MGSSLQYDYWLFDLDGTLVDVEPAYARSVFDEVGARLGCRFTDREVAVLWHGLTGSRNDELRRKGIDPDRFWTVFHEVEDPQARAEATFLHEDAAFVGDLDVPVGIVTHCQRYLTDAVLDHLDLFDWFDAVVCCDDDLGWKPDPAPVRRAQAELGVDRQVATDGGAGAGAGAGVGDGGAGDEPGGSPTEGASGVLAGDGSGDIGAAWNAGLEGIHVERHGHDRRGQCVLGDYRVRSFEDLSLPV